MKSIINRTLFTVLTLLFAQVWQTYASVIPQNNSQTVKIIENKGQWNSQVLFRADIPGGTLFITPTGLMYSFIDEKTLHDVLHDHIGPGIVNGHNYKVTFENANAPTNIIKELPSSEYYNYFIGNNKDKWASECRAFGKITLVNIYEGIDLEVIALNDHIKTNFIVKPFASASVIKLNYEGQNSISLFNNELTVETSVSAVKENKPEANQPDILSKNDVKVNYHLQNNQLTFKIGHYNHSFPLIIDPEIVFGTFSGSFADNWGYTATFDTAGHAFSGGAVFDLGFPVTTGAFQLTFNGGDGFGLARDCGILKYSSDGSSLLYATYIGGNHNEQPHSMVADKAGNLYIMGTTWSTDFPTPNGYDQSQNGEADIFVSKLSADGTAMLSSTYLGGTKDDGLNGSLEFYDPITQPLTYNYGDNFRGEIVLDNSNNAYIATTTYSTTSDFFPIVNGFQTAHGGKQDGCIIKLKADLSDIIFSSYLGGSGDDGAFGIVIDNLNDIYVCGGTTSSDIGSTTGTFSHHGDVDAYVAKIAGTGNSLQKFLHVGTTKFDQAYLIQLDNQKNVYITGQTEGNISIKGDVVSSTNAKHFIISFNRQLDSIKLSTTFGVSGHSFPALSPSAFLVDICGRVYFSGWGGTTNSGHFNSNLETTHNLPLTADAFQKTTDGSDFYLIVFAPNMKSIAYATYMGGTSRFGGGEHVDGGTSRFDKNGVVYQSVCGGCGGSSSFPTTPGAWSRRNNSSNCNNALFKMNMNMSNTAPKMKDTLLSVFVGDILNYSFDISDTDGDNITTAFSGSLIAQSPNGPIITKVETKGNNRVSLQWTPTCSNQYDTLFLTVTSTDDGCPSIKTGIGTIKIITLFHLAPPPFFECLKTINDHSVKLQWQNISSTKYLKGYKIYRKKNDQNPEFVADVMNKSIHEFVDTTAQNHVINNYCYFILPVNLCDSVGDTSRIVCSVFRSDTSTIPVFKLTKDTILYVYAFDTIEYSTIIKLVDPKDSVYMQSEGSMLGNVNLILFDQQNNLSQSSLHLKWVAKCEGLNSADTPYIHFFVKDNQCPSPRTQDGLIRIVVVQPPANTPPALSCIKYINDDKVEIKWPESTVNKYFQRFILLKQSPDGTIIPYINVDNTDAFLREDIVNNNLKNNYCYAVTAQDVCGYYSDTSDFKCTTRVPSDYPFTVPFYTITVKDNQEIAAFWHKSTEDNFTRYALYKKPLQSSGAYTLVYEGSNTSDTSFIDKNVKVQEKSYCYKISQVNDCGLESQTTSEACSILLKGVSNPFEHTLKWNGYNYWRTGVIGYDVIRMQPNLSPEYVAQNTSKDTQNFDNRLNYENGLYHYVIKATENSKNVASANISLSNEIELIQAPLVHAPNAFTPNDDGLNETWNVVPVFVKDFDLKVYDRWGKLVFETTDKHKQFNGNVQNGETATCDVFAFIINYTGWDGLSYQKKGNLTILR